MDKKTLKFPISQRHCRNIDIKGLIELYRKHECLWNPSNGHYKYKSVRHQAWTRIANRFGQEMVDIKRKVKHLRTAYVAEKKKVDASKKSGAVPPYEPVLYYYNYLNFLDNVVVWRKENNDYEFGIIYNDMNKKPLSRTAKYYQKVPLSNRHCGNIDIKELIEHYQQYECLWNLNSIDYKNKPLKHQAWMRIAKHFGKEMLDVKRKVKYLRTAYVAEKKKVDNSKRSGAEPQYQPNLYYYNYLDFLNDVVVWRKGYNDLESESVEISQEVDDDFLHFAKKEDVELDLPPEQELSPEPSPVPSYSPSPPPTPPQKKHIISTPKIFSTRSLNSRPPIRKLSKEYKPNRTIDGQEATYNSSQNSVYTSFGTTISLQLQQLPLDVATETMSEIHLILSKKILEFIKREQNGHQQPMSYSDNEYSDSDLIEIVKEDM